MRHVSYVIRRLAKYRIQLCIIDGTWHYRKQNMYLYTQRVWRKSIESSNIPISILNSQFYMLSWRTNILACVLVVVELWELHALVQFSHEQMFHFFLAVKGEIMGLAGRTSFSPFQMCCMFQKMIGGFLKQTLCQIQEVAKIPGIVFLFQKILASSQYYFVIYLSYIVIPFHGPQCNLHEVFAYHLFTVVHHVISFALMWQ